MAYIGLKYPVFAPIQSEGADGFPTYGSGIIVGHAIASNITISSANVQLYGDDISIESVQDFQGGTVSLNPDDLTKEDAAAMCGSKIVTNGGKEVVRDASTYMAPYGGYGFFRVRVKKGVRSIRAYWLYKTQWALPSEESATKAESTSFQTPTMEGTIMALGDADNTWREWADFASENEAKAWLNDHANINTANRTELNAKIEEIEALDPETYTSASWVAVANALVEAKAAAARENLSQEHADLEVANLTAAQNKLIAAA